MRRSSFLAVIASATLQKGWQQHLVPAVAKVQRRPHAFLALEKTAAMPAINTGRCTPKISRMHTGHPAGPQNKSYLDGIGLSVWLLPQQTATLHCQEP